MMRINSVKWSRLLFLAFSLLTLLSGASAELLEVRLRDLDRHVYAMAEVHGHSSQMKDEFRYRYAGFWEKEAIAENFDSSSHGARTKSRQAGYFADGFASCGATVDTHLWDSFFSSTTNKSSDGFSRKTYSLQLVTSETGEFVQLPYIFSQTIQSDTHPTSTSVFTVRSRVRIYYKEDGREFDVFPYEPLTNIGSESGGGLLSLRGGQHYLILVESVASCTDQAARGHHINVNTNFVLGWDAPTVFWTRHGFRPIAEAAPPQRP